MQIQIFMKTRFISRRKLPKMYGENFRQAPNKLSNNKLHI